jgi:hypothetical protein
VINSKLFLSQVNQFINSLPEPAEQFDEINWPFDHYFYPKQKLVIHVVPFAKPDLKYSLIASQNLRLTDEAAHHNLKIIHLHQDVWQTKTAIVQSRISAALGISQRVPARLTQVRRIDKPTLDNFLTNNHLQGYTKAKFKYGLFLPQRYFRVLDQSFQEKLQLHHSTTQQLSNSATQQLSNSTTQPLSHSATQQLLVAVASFSGGKKIVRNGQACRSYELIRFANLLGCTVVGGFDKLLKKFIEENQPDDIMTYADRDWSDGRSYEKLGFERIAATPPQSFLINPQTLERHHHLEANDQLGFIKIWNTGNWKYIKPFYSTTTIF